MTDKQIVVLRKLRSTVRACATKDCSKAASYLSATTAPQSIEIEVLVGKLTQYRAQLKEYDSQIFLSIDDDSIDAEINKSMDYDDKIFDLCERLKFKLRGMDNEKVQTAQAPVPSKVTVNLPKLEILKFSGEPLRWAEFWDSFQSTIHENKNLTSVEKFKYLRSFLEGEALGLADGYRLTADNYDSVIAVLKQRFGDPQVAIFSHFETLLALPTANHELNQLQKIFDECEKHIRSLVALGLEENTFGQVFTPIILSKLPKYVKMELHQRNGSNRWSLDTLRNFFEG